MFTDEELASIKWLASLVHAQLTSERHQLTREYGGYNDRGWMQSRLDDVKRKQERAQSVLDALTREAE